MREGNRGGIGGRRNPPLLAPQRSLFGNFFLSQPQYSILNGKSSKKVPQVGVFNVRRLSRVSQNVPLINSQKSTKLQILFQFLVAEEGRRGSTMPPRPT